MIEVKSPVRCVPFYFYMLVATVIYRTLKLDRKRPDLSRPIISMLNSKTQFLYSACRSKCSTMSPGVLKKTHLIPSWWALKLLPSKAVISTEIPDTTTENMFIILSRNDIAEIISCKVFETIYLLSESLCGAQFGRMHLL